jgi:hypothetical protein
MMASASRAGRIAIKRQQLRRDIIAVGDMHELY